MKIALIILISFIALIFVLLLLPVRLLVDYKKDDVTNETSFVIRYLFWNFKLFKNKNKEKKKPKEKPKEEKKPVSFSEKRDKVSKYIKIFEDIKDEIGQILDYAAQKAVVFEKIYTDIEFGFEDAMHTGIFTGVLNGFVYGVLGFIHQHSRLLDMRVNIQPVFDNPSFKVQAGCILRLKNVHIIIVAINILKILRKIRKTERSS
ncbi:MAG: DUF2953 domain-containing protein [Clostridia bacterium]|nr:DUF2953 domain-containing protein [Clostridia bacterium]